MIKKKILVLSGINMVDGGILSIYQDCLKSLIEHNFHKQYKIIALVGRKELFEFCTNKIRIIEFRNSKKSWILRLFYEYIYFFLLSKKINVYAWISMHDMSPNVIAERQFVYCHNCSQFSMMKFSEIKYGIKYYLFSKFYKYLYAINISKNMAVIVQQDWIRSEFKKIYKLNNIIVSRPSIPESNTIDNNNYNGENIFLYPSYPRYFKNFQVLCQATNLLEKQDVDFKVYITIDGTENLYSKELVEEYQKNKNIIFCGLLSRTQLYDLYSRTKCLVFMSKLETFGMPIIEFKQTNRPIILPNLPYAHESIGDYDNVAFVDENNAETLAEKMLEVIKNNRLNEGSESKYIENPFVKDWKELFDYILIK